MGKKEKKKIILDPKSRSLFDKGLVREGQELVIDLHLTLAIYLFVCLFILPTVY